MAVVFMTLCVCVGDNRKLLIISKHEKAVLVHVYRSMDQGQYYVDSISRSHKCTGGGSGLVRDECQLRLGSMQQLLHYSNRSGIILQKAQIC